MEESNNSSSNRSNSNSSSSNNNNNNNGRLQRRRLNKKQQRKDRLSSLPDALIASILSLLPINSAALTSVLSRRWKSLWTGVARFVFLTHKTEASKTIALIIKILPKLTSLKLDKFELIMLHSESDLSQLNATEPCFLDILRRKVEHLVFKVGPRCFFRVPSCVFRSPTLVVLELFGGLKIDVPENVAAIHLPCLKRLTLHRLLGVPPCLGGNLFESCPLLEDLYMSFSLVCKSGQSTVHSPVNISSPNLKSLAMHVYSCIHLPRMKVSIDAPILVNLEIYDCYSFYYLLQNPSSLVDALIDLTGWDEDEDAEEVDEVRLNGLRERVRTVLQMSKIVERMSSVRKLVLYLESPTNIFTCYLDEYVKIPTFSTLAYLEINLYGSRLDGYKDLLFFLNCFPNLEQLVVRVDHEVHNEIRWSVPDSKSAPYCLVSKLKLIKLWGLQGTHYDLKLVAYILRTAEVLGKISIANTLADYYDMWKEFWFVASVLKLPRTSSTCEMFITSGEPIPE